MKRYWETYRKGTGGRVLDTFFLMKEEADVLETAINCTPGGLVLRIHKTLLVLDRVGNCKAEIRLLNPYALEEGGVVVKYEYNKGAFDLRFSDPVKFGKVKEVEEIC